MVACQVSSLTELCPQPRTEVLSPRTLELILSPSITIWSLGRAHRAKDKALSASNLLSGWVSFSRNCHLPSPTGCPGAFDIFACSKPPGCHRLAPGTSRLLHLTMYNTSNNCSQAATPSSVPSYFLWVLRAARTHSYPPFNRDGFSPSGLCVSCPSLKVNISHVLDAAKSFGL